MKDNDLLIPLKKQLNKLVTDDANFKIALSGGLDSIVLLHLFSRLDYQVVAHHVHHGLSKNADNWASFCQSIAQKFGIEYQVSKVVLDKQNRTSLEALAREKRYAMLKEGLSDQSYLVTAHHQDDQLETMLLALKRGAGLTGLQGIVAYQTLTIGHLIRPLLNFSREQLESYAQQFELEWIEDESNSDQNFDRNFIRHSITPLLKARWPQIASTMSRSASHCQSQQQLIDEITESDFQGCYLTESQTLHIPSLKFLTATRRNNVLRCWFKSAMLSYPSSQQLLAIWENIVLANESAEPKLLLQGKSICRYRDALYLVEQNKVSIAFDAQAWKGENVVELAGGRITLQIEVLDKQLITQHDVQICFREQLASGLKCQPIGRDKRRSIKKLLHEYQIAPWLRDNVPFLIIDGTLVEAIGVFKCATKYSHLIKIKII